MTPLCDPRITPPSLFPPVSRIPPRPTYASNDKFEENRSPNVTLPGLISAPAAASCCELRARQCKYWVSQYHKLTTYIPDYSTPHRRSLPHRDDHVAGYPEKPKSCSGLVTHTEPIYVPSRNRDTSQVPSRNPSTSPWPPPPIAFDSPSRPLPIPTHMPPGGFVPSELDVECVTVDPENHFEG